MVQLVQNPIPLKRPILTLNNHTINTNNEQKNNNIMKSSESLSVSDVSKEVWFITKLIAQLLWAFRISSKWIIMFIRLLLFTICCLPSFIKILWYWLFDSKIHKNIAYGTKKRNLLDIYTVGSIEKSIPNKYPVVVFFSGGAWIIGYKAWGSLMGKIFSSCGVVFVTPDYRNFPQGNIHNMIDDASLAIEWVFTNIKQFNGDPENVSLMGQSAGAHISACVLINQAKKEGSLNSDDIKWKASKLKQFVGISGPYNIRRCIEVFHSRGFDESILSRIMNHDISYYSPTLQIHQIGNNTNIIKCFPKICLFHGTSDLTVPWKITDEFGQVLRQYGISCSTKFYANKSHTDPIIEDPILGNDPLMIDLLQLIDETTPLKSPRPKLLSEKSSIHLIPKQMQPYFLIKLARFVNPF